MCRCLGIQVSGFYAWLQAPLSRRAKEDVRQTELIRKAWQDSGKVYGYRKLPDDLLVQGEHRVGHPRPLTHRMARPPAAGLAEWRRRADLRATPDHR